MGKKLPRWAFGGKMQFIDAFNAFHNWAEYNRVSPNAQLLWTKLLYLFNKNFWPEKLSIQPALLLAHTHFARAGTLSEARNELIQNGWLEYDKDNKEYGLKFPTLNAAKKDKKAKPSLPYEEIKDFWNDHHGDMPKIEKITSQRKQKLRRITKDHTLDDIKAMILKAEKSDFLNGRTGSWKADFDFFLRPDKFDKTLEGGFDDNKRESESLIDPDEDIYAAYR